MPHDIPGPARVSAASRATATTVWATCILNHPKTPETDPVEHGSIAH